MKTEHCLNTLLSEDIDVERKYDALGEYLSWWGTFGAREGIGRRQGRLTGAMDLEQAAARLLDGKLRLAKVLGSIGEVSTRRKQARDEDERSKRTTLRQIASGTPIIIASRGQEHSVFFLELRRTKLVCEFPDGHKVLAPLTTFQRLAPDAGIERLDPALSAQLDVVRALAGREAYAARHVMLQQGTSMLPALMTELGNALRRIASAPVGRSEGLLRDSIGLVQKINPIDQALVKQIPKVVVSIAQEHGLSQVLETVARESSDDPRKVCYEEFAHIWLNKEQREGLAAESDRLMSASPELGAVVGRLLARR